MSLKTIVLVGGFAAVIAGIGGMLFSLPFLFSSNIQAIIGAGFPFVGGAVLAGFGLVSLAIVLRNTKEGKITIEN